MQDGADDSDFGIFYAVCIKSYSGCLSGADNNVTDGSM